MFPIIVLFTKFAAIGHLLYEADKVKCLLRSMWANINVKFLFGLVDKINLNEFPFKENERCIKYWSANYTKYPLYIFKGTKDLFT